jgi:hypothetical protein
MAGDELDRSNIVIALDTSTISPLGNFNELLPN